uniref:Uncharacterized protein LOC111112440 isoform X2 n=1 Tax=Crassostrea virginica TaxID=6565 RepID=A0A8B8BQL6_CRAVI|nr:uncharacterized protein LOC111112440 isoform X2 [Crassostrea virginica]
MKVVFLYLSLGALLSETRGGSLSISTRFNDGDVSFMWNGPSSDSYDVALPGLRDGAFNVNGSNYTVKNAIDYESIIFDVKAKSDTNYSRIIYKVSKIESKEGDSVTISWTAPFFPQAGVYTIYHQNKANRSIIQVTSNTVTTQNSKYEYLSQPFNSTNITFMLRNITLDDAGYYAGGIGTEAAWSGGGVVLIVLGNPSTPNITGLLNIPVGNTTNLTCSSTSTSSPDYYAKLVKLSYKWFVNGKDVQKPIGDIRFSERYRDMRFTVSKNHRYNQYSCEAIEKNLLSKRSDPVQINPLYEPGTMSISGKPDIHNGKLTVKEGETVGPYNCSADCNPPCEIKWRYKDIDDKVNDASSSGQELSVLKVNRNISLLRCIAIYMNKTDDKKKHNITLDVQYLDNPVVLINNKNGEPNHPVEIREGGQLRLSCNVNGNPVPKITLQKVAGDSKINQSTSGDWLNHTMQSLECSNIGTYKCTGMSPGFNDTEKMFRINVSCDTRLDYSLPMKTLYGSKSGQDIKITVAVPVIANPPPHKSSVRWFGPVEDLDIASTVSQQDVPYKHRINSSIPILDQNYFGNYTLKYNMTDVVTITINAEDVPQVPRNFNGYSYASGYINLTWVSGFDGGEVQHFILSIKDQFGWHELANLSDPGQGRVVHYESGRLNAGQKYWYQLKSCNIINCSKESAEITITPKAEPRLSVLLDKTFVIGASSAVVILILTIVFVLIILKRKTALNRQDNQQDGAEIADQPDVVLYAAVDKSAFQKNQNKADVVAEAVPEKKDETDNLYAVVEKKTTTEAKPSATKPESEQKNECKRERQEGATAAEATGASGTSRNVNQDGLIYIDVDFAKKPENKDKNEKPKIHGEEDRTEYTFVDFSKKAPVVKEKPKKEEEK